MLCLQHVLSLKDFFPRREKVEHSIHRTANLLRPQQCVPTVGPCHTAYCCQLLTNGSYLLEINAYTELQGVIEVNTIALSTLPREDQSIALQGSLNSHPGQLLVIIDKPAEGVKWLKQSYEISSHDVPFNLRESAWAAGNAANGIASLNDFAEAIKWQELARDHWLEWSNKQDTGRGAWTADLQRGMGMTLIWSGQLQPVREVSTLPIQQIESTEPYIGQWQHSEYSLLLNFVLQRANFKAPISHSAPSIVTIEGSSRPKPISWRRRTRG